MDIKPEYIYALKNSSYISSEDSINFNFNVNRVYTFTYFTNINPPTNMNRHALDVPLHYRRFDKFESQTDFRNRGYHTRKVTDLNKWKEHFGVEGGAEVVFTIISAIVLLILDAGFGYSVL